MQTASHSVLKVGILFTVLGLGTFGCGTSEPSRFYVLKAAAGDSTPRETPTTIRIGLHPFEIPQYLMRMSIVTLQEGNRLELAEYDRWAEALDANLMRVLATNLSHMVPGGIVYRYPWRRDAGVAVELEGEVIQFGREDDGNVHMAVRWTLRRDGEMAGAQRNFVFERPPVSEGFGGIVDMMNQAVTALSREIASEISRMNMPEDQTDRR